MPNEPLAYILLAVIVCILAYALRLNALERRQRRRNAILKRIMY